jgi:DNA-directed RNA polymerase beta' subunit
VKIDLVNVDNVSDDLPEITFAKPFENRKFAKEGLFSQQLFGPLKSYHCACTKNPYKGPRYEQPVCPVCNVKITTAEMRKRQFGKIKLPFPILNPLFLYLVASKRATIRKVIQEMLSFKAKYFFDEDGNLAKLVDVDNPDPNIEYLEGLEGVLAYVRYLIEIDKIKASDENTNILPRAELTYIDEHWDQLTIQNVIVIPPEFRPCGKLRGDNYVSDDINKRYQKIIKISTELKNLPFPVRDNDAVYQTNFKYLQKLVQELYDSVLESMSKKTGLIRSNILGKRVDFSGRAVISPDPTLNLDECRLPYWMVLEILKPCLITHFINKRVCKRYNQAIKLIDESIENSDPKFFDIVEEFCADKVCVLNRQPTLHRLSVLAFKVKVHLGNTIQIHPLICSPYNADFDGDAMAVYFPITPEAIADTKKNLGIWANLLSPTDLEAVPKPNQDIILGIYTATKEQEDEQTRVYKGAVLPFGRYLFNMCLPTEYPVINETVTKNKLRSIMNDICLNYPPKQVMDTFDKIKSLGFSMVTIEGFTLSLFDLYDEQLIRYADELTGNVEEDMETLKSDPAIVGRLKELPFAIFIESGARGTWDQARQMVLSRGYVADADNHVRETLIRSSLTTGLTPVEFFNSCWGSRKGLLDTALSTGDTGYLTRQLIYSTVNMELGEEDDCGTTDTLDLFVADANVAKSLMWRFIVGGNGQKILVTHNNYREMVGKIVKLRSPIYCKNNRVCKTCYGNLYKILHSDQIGIIATQAIGERATQLVLRTFHISGAASTSGGKSGDNDDIISGMTIAKKMFHSPEDITTPGDLVRRIYKVFGQYGDIKNIHFEVITASMMWHGNKLWRLLPARNTVEPEYVSILQVPARSSWLLGCAFSNLKQKLITGLIEEEVDESSALTSLFRY